MMIPLNVAYNAVLDEMAVCPHPSDDVTCDACQKRQESVLDALILEAQREIAEPLIAALEKCAQTWEDARDYRALNVWEGRSLASALDAIESAKAKLGEGVKA